MKKFFKYLDVQLDTRWLYTPSHTVVVPALLNKATVEDELTIWIKTEKSVFNLWYIDIIDPTIEADVDELLALWGMHWIKAITTTEAKQMLLDNWYTEISTDVIEISPEQVWIDNEIIPQKTLEII